MQMIMQHLVYQEKSLENYFATHRSNIIGREQLFETPYGEQKIIYADWTATGRAYAPIEESIQQQILPFLGNTHTGATVTGSMMSAAYHEARLIIKEHVHAADQDVLLFCGSGMTAAVNKLQRILGLRMPGSVTNKSGGARRPRPGDSGGTVVFVTHMEHHSNHISWLETIATVEIIQADEEGNVDLVHFRSLLHKYRQWENKIAAITACSNVTGILTPIHVLAKLIHEYGGLCFIDFASAAPYVNIDMHPQESGTHLDAIYFSMHKFLGGPGTPGVLIFNKKIYNSKIPDQPGGGTLLYSNPWQFHDYLRDIETREDGGTPPFLQGIKAAMCIKLKEEMGAVNIRRREEEMVKIILDRFAKMRKVVLLEKDNNKRLPIFSFLVEGAHYNLVVALLNDRFGIQARGGCSCAGTYGHLLLNIDKRQSEQIFTAIQSGDLSRKPGWTRLSFHPVMTDHEINHILDALELIASRIRVWKRDYQYDQTRNEFVFKGNTSIALQDPGKWFRHAIGKCIGTMFSPVSCDVL